jgi:hypothetical protein
MKGVKNKVGLSLHCELPKMRERLILLNVAISALERYERKGRDSKSTLDLGGVRLRPFLLRRRAGQPGVTEKAS